MDDNSGIAIAGPETSELTDVRSIQPVDPSAAVLPVIDLENFKLVADPPLVLEPRLDEETQQIFKLDIDELGIFVCGSTREELMDEFHEHMKFAWLEYAETEDAELSEDARELTRALLSRFKRVCGHPRSTPTQPGASTLRAKRAT